MVETLLPNLSQVAPIWETGRNECEFSGPMMSRWTMPLDDTHTMFLEFRHVSEKDGETPAWWADRNIMLPGQLAADSYEEGQLHPGDYEAQVSQRPIAIHGLEHLGATDRGITMFRRQIRRGIRAVAKGEDPPGVVRNGGGVIPTYCNNTIVRAEGRGRGARQGDDARDRNETGNGVPEVAAALERALRRRALLWAALPGAAFMD
jgi:hypothetical protein